MRPLGLRVRQELLSVAAKAGVVSAVTTLGRMYERGGTGWAPNVAKAAELYFTAMERGDGAAANRMGELYLDGTGVAVNAVEAVRCFYQA